MATEIKLQKLKENVETVEVNEVLVSAGQMVEQGQPLIVVNADKANMEVPAPVAGRLVQLRVKVGDEVRIGDVYCVIEANGEPAAATAARTGENAVAAVHKEVRKIEQTARPTLPPPRPQARPAVLPAALEDGGENDTILAGPATRWLARKLGVDLRSVRGTGAKGRVTEEDVKNHFAGGRGQGGGVQAPPLPNFEEFGEVQREPLTRVRRLTAQRMSTSWSLIPHVTQHDLADVTDLDVFRKQQESKGPKLTVTAFALKACAIALKQYPTFNSTLDLEGGHLIVKKYYNIGVAVDTKAGLLVPVIRDVDRKSVEQLARELTEMAEQARVGKADMSGGSFTITNLGGIGGTGFTPIVNHPEVAILGMSRSRLEPTVRDGTIVPRLLLPLSLSYDHRVIDGAAAARFTRRVAELLESPWLMLLHA